VSVCMGFKWPNGSDQWPAAHRLATTNRHARESIASRGSGRSSTWSRHPTSRPLDSTGAPGPLANADRPPPKSASSRDGHRDASNGGADPGQTASGAFTPLQPLGPTEHALYRAHAARRRPEIIFIYKRPELRSPDWADMRKRFGLRRFRTSMERFRSMARGHRIIHAAGLHRESIASGGSD